MVVPAAVQRGRADVRGVRNQGRRVVRHLPGCAAKKATRMLQALGYTIIGRECFYVADSTGPLFAWRSRTRQAVGIRPPVPGSSTGENPGTELLLIPGTSRTSLLGLARGGALLGIAFRILWPNAPRWLYTPIYIALGWTSIFFADDFLRAGAPVAVTPGCRWSSTPWAASSTASADPTRPRCGSGTTRCSTA